MNRIRELRKQKDMTQKELAKHLQVADSTLSYWEMGKYEPDNEALMKLSRFFHVPIDYIIGGDFDKWDLSENTTPYRYVVEPHLPGSGMSVSEHKAAYGIGGIQETQSPFDRVEFEGLKKEEIDLLAEYAEFIKSRRSKQST